MRSIPGLGNQVLDILGPELSYQALGSNLWIQRVMSSILGHGVKVGGKKRTKNVCFWMIEGWDGAHCLAFLKAPHFDVKHLEIGQETKKLGPLPPKCHEFESRTWQLSFKFFHRLGFRGSGLLSKIFFVFKFGPRKPFLWIRVIWYGPRLIFSFTKAIEKN